MLTSYSIKNIYSHFEYKELTKVDGEPTLDTILLLHRQVKRNAQSVPTTLGDGQLGDLVLVISAIKYNTIHNSTPFVRPTAPGQFTVQLPTSQDTTLNAVNSLVAATGRTTRSVARTSKSHSPDQPPLPTN